MEGLTDVRPGDVLAGKFRIERVLGQGGMGVVVSAHHLQLDERIAIKFLLPQALESAEAVARFAREARAAVKIKSEHVARVIDVGTLETGSPYMVMEYLHGRDLSQLVQQRGPLTIEEATEYVLQACEAIAEAHSLGIIHRDLKPQNLFLINRADGSPCIKVLDFGISKVTSIGGGSSGSDMSMTKTTAVMGSPLYMSPEQMTSSRDVDPRTDIWALGVILYELLTARVPFSADTVPQLCAMILQSSAPPLRNFRPDAPEGLQNVLLRSLEKDPTRRYKNVAEFAAALLPYAPRSARTSVERVSRVLGAAGIATTALDLPPSSAAPAVQVTQAAWGQTVSSKSRTPWILLALGVFLAGGAGTAALLVRSNPATTATEANPTLTPAKVTAVTPAAAPPPRAEPSLQPKVAPTPPPQRVIPSVAVVPAPTPKPRPPAAVRPAANPIRTAKPVHASGLPAPPPTTAPARPPIRDLYGDRK